MTSEAIKISLIQHIIATRDLVKLKRIYTFFSPEKESDLLLTQLSKPAREHLDIEELIREQNIRPIEKDDFLKKIESLDIQEPLDDLLAMV